MKKFLSLILALALVMSLGTVAFADGAIGADNPAATGSDTQEVKVIVEDEKKTDNYKVDISWPTLQFTYDLGTKKWNTTSHEWEVDGDKGAKWTAGEPSGTITVTNHSSQKVDVEFSYTGVEESVGGVTGWNTASCTFSQGTSFDGGEFNSNTAKLKSADQPDAGAPQSGQVAFNFTGLPTPKEAVRATKIGSFTATVKPGTIAG